MRQLNFLNAMDVRTHPHHWTLFVDGASRNNPGPAGAGIYIVKEGEDVCKEGFFLGVKTNNQAEYLALILGLLILGKYMQQSNDTVRVVSDSELLVRQLKGEYKVKHPDLKQLHVAARTLLAQYNAHIVHVLRTENTEADAMANRGIEQKKSIPNDLLTLLHTYEITV